MPTPTSDALRTVRRRRRILPGPLSLILSLVLLPAVPGARAHAPSRAPVPGLQALHTDADMTVDGALDEPFWKDCTVATGLIDQRTGKPAGDQTLIRVAYTSTYLYVGVECLDSNMAALHATERREDRSFVGDDWVEVHFDPPHSHRGKYAFFTNPLGTKADANEGPQGVFNYGWSAQWDCAAKILPDRWTFEMRIPLGIMNYFRTDGRDWGFNITRLQRSTDVTSFWSFSATDFYKPRHFGHLQGLDLAGSKFDRGWEVSPYASVRADLDGDTRMHYDAGVDVKFRLTPAIISSWTVNPDFGQIEADDDTIELRDTERFLSERRPFFNEGEELMRMTHSLYYSRRFTDPDAGAKISGQQPGFNFNAQNIQGKIAHDGSFRGNSTVLRATQEVGERSTLGYYAAASVLDEGHAATGGFDGYFFLSDAWRFSFQGALADDELADRLGLPLRSGTDYLGAASLLYETYPWRLGLTYTAITDGFNPLLGYIPRRDIFGPSWHTDYNVRAGTGWYKEFYLSYDPKVFQNSAGDLALHDHSLYGSVLLRCDHQLRASYDNQYHLPFYNWRAATGVDLWASDFYRGLGVTWANGEFEHTDYHEFILSKRLKFWERLPIRLDFTLRLEDRPTGESAVVWLNRVVFDLYLTDRMWVKASLQIRDDGQHNHSVIYGWRFLKPAWWYVVFNNVDEGTDDTTSLMTKVVYTF